MKKQNTKTTKKGTFNNSDPFDGCVLAEEERQGKSPSYSYRCNGLPELNAKTSPGWSPVFEQRANSNKK